MQRTGTAAGDMDCHGIHNGGSLANAEGSPAMTTQRFTAAQDILQYLSPPLGEAQPDVGLVQRTGTGTRGVDHHTDADRGNIAKALRSGMIPCYDYRVVYHWPQDFAMSIISWWRCSARFWSDAENRDSCWRHGSSWNMLTEGI